MHEELEFDIWYHFMYFFYFFEREFTRKDNALHSDISPELDLCPIRIISLHGEMYFCIWKIFPHQIDEAWITHDIGIGFERFHLFESLHKRSDLHVMCVDIGSKVDFFATSMTVFYALGETFPGELIFASTE